MADVIFFGKTKDSAKMKGLFSMTRSEQREQAFILIFEKIFNNASIDELIENAHIASELSICEFAKNSAAGVEEHNEEIDSKIEACATGWQKRRISKVALAILRLAIYEIMYDEKIPTNVSINEAIELAKKYATAEDASFVNGVLGGVVRALNEAAKEEVAPQ
jgi:N utilization substance protein B